jgi:hypothetical protein
MFKFEGWLPDPKKVGLTLWGLSWRVGPLLAFSILQGIFNFEPNRETLLIFFAVVGIYVGFLYWIDRGLDSDQQKLLYRYIKLSIAIFWLVSLSRVFFRTQWFSGGQ